ncbi:methyltransferase [Parasphingorhabdus pacifica]
MSGDPVDVWAMADLATPFAIRTVATLHVADAVKDGPIPLGELAQHCGANPDPLGRVLRFLVHRGVFTEPEPDTFGPNEASHALESEAPHELRAWLDLDGAIGRSDLAFVELLGQVRGKHIAYPAAYGRTLTEDLESRPELSESFDDLMDSKSEDVVPDVVDSYDWDRFTRVVDVGGGKGILLAELLRTYPSLHGGLVDLPGPASKATEHLEARGVGPRAETANGNLFDPLPISGDAFILLDVLGDWDDQDAVRILSRCAEAAGDDGSVLIIELSADPDDQRAFTEMDLRMMVYVGGRMRDLTRTREIASAAGLFVANVTQLDNGYCITECLPDR